jgi:hypothetical protein
MRLTVDRGLNVVAVVACAAALATVVQSTRRVHGQVSEKVTHAEAPVSTAYARGDRLLSIGGVEFGKSTRTLLLYVTTSCQYCIDSVPFYQDLAIDRDYLAGRLKLMIVGSEPIDHLNAFAARYRLRPDQILVSRDESRVRVAPTLVLVDERGTIEDVWSGEQSAARRAAIRQQLRRK